MADSVKFNSTSETKYNGLATKEAGTFYRTDKHMYLGATQIDNVKASTTESGTIQLGYTTVEPNYAVQTDTNGKAYVTIPNYIAGTGLTLTGKTFAVKITDKLNLDDNTTLLSAKAGKTLKDSLSGYLSLNGETVLGNVFVSGISEGDLGVNYTGGKLYLFGWNVGDNSGQRGLYDSKKQMVINVSDTSTLFYGDLKGNADTATTAGNVTGVVAVAHGGTGVTALWGNPSLLHSLFPADLGSSPYNFIPAFETDWASGGYYSLVNLKAALGINLVNNTADANKSVKYATSAGSATSATSATTAGNVTGIVAIANGGTAANNAATARTNLGITLANLGAAAASHGHSDLQNQINTLNSNKARIIISEQAINFSNGGAYFTKNVASYGTPGFVSVIGVATTMTFSCSVTNGSAAQFQIYIRDTNTAVNGNVTIRVCYFF